MESTSNTAGRVGIVAGVRRIAGDQQDVADPHRVRAEQIRLHAEQVAVAARVVKDRLDPRLLLDHHRRGQRADSRARTRPFGDVDQVDAVRAELARLRDQWIGTVSARRNEFDRDHELAGVQCRGHPGLVFARHHLYLRRDSLRAPAWRSPWTCAGASARTAILM